MFNAARVVVLFGFIAQVAGFAKILVVAAYFGAGPLLDAYYLGLVVPTFLQGLSAGVLQASFIPLYVEARARSDEQAASHIRNVALTWTLGLLALVAACVTLTQSLTLPVFTSGLEPQVRIALSAAFAVLIWTAPLNAVADAITMLMNAESRFVAVACAPVVNAVVSSVVLFAWPNKGIAALTASLFTGLFTQIAIAVVAMYRANIRVRPAFAIPAALPRSMISLALPVLISNIAVNLIPAFIQTVSGRASTGAVSALGYATRLHNAVVQTAVMSVSLVLLPHFARLLAEQRIQELRASLERVFAATLVLSLATLTFVAVAGQEAIGLLLERGRFTHADGAMVAKLWLSLSLGLMGTTWGVFLIRLFQAWQLPWVIARFSIVSVVVNVVLTLLLMPGLGVVGIALANSLMYAVIMVLYHGSVTRRLGPFLTRNTLVFLTWLIAANVVAYFSAAAWAACLPEASVELVVVGQFLMVMGANVLVSRLTPLRIPLVALIRR